MMRVRTLLGLGAGVAAAAVLAGCGDRGKSEPKAPAETTAPTTPTAVAEVVWPPSLAPFGDGYPNSGNPCKRVGETAATSNFLDDSADLVGCPGSATGVAAKGLVEGRGGHVVAEVDGFTLVSVPRGGPAAAGTPPPATPSQAAPVAAAAATPASGGRIRFRPGATSGAVSGTVVGDDSVTYVVGAQTGQTLNVIKTGSSNAYFNVFAPGDKPGRDEALFIGSTSGDDFEARLDESGDYTIQVYQMRASARRGVKAPFTLTVEID
ncbi:hypothetical protein [Caulobacter mirabilis]|uniref:Uncharacterized protein n=1 Tax=Caulobacter mirabilis TaxID=69666 RepID=A0A2D2B0P8_9CAUL|nr:hypothetical protein [Caulobacter mirabilis]ATQ43757.1 hypothetical protein CSW64_15825 [Caulobacter mirabilis]